MIKNYLLIAVRNLFKSSTYSIINISGLAIGLVCSILISLWVLDETSYDDFIPKRDRLYQVWTEAFFDNTINRWRSVPQPTVEAMKTADSHIVNSVVLDWSSEHLLVVGDTRIYKNGYYASEEFLEMFEFPLIHGDPSLVLDEASGIVISESTAEALFGDEDPLNKVIRLDNDSDLKVSGVFEDVPGNSTFQFDILIPWKHGERSREWIRDNKDNWDNSSYQVFVELDNNANHKIAESSVKGMLMEKNPGDIETSLFLYPMERWRLYSTFEEGKEKGGLIEYVQLFTAIAIIILIIACINFMNLATARSAKRSKEVGIRKTVGSGRRELIFQFLSESVVIALVSYIIAIMIVLIILPFYNNLVDKELTLNFTSLGFWGASLGIILITGLIAGSYPAFYLSSFKPATILKGVSVGDNANLPRKVLVVIQFMVAIVLLVSTVIIYQQIELARSRDLGYNQEKLVTIDLTKELDKNYDTFKNEILTSGAVESMTRSNSSVTQITSNNMLGWPGKPDDVHVIFSTITSHYDYSKTMGIEILEGRDFSKDFASDSSAILVNKAALDVMQLDEPVLGTELDLWGEKRTLIGVLGNTLMGSVYNEVKPMFVIMDNWGGVITMRLTAGQDIQENLATIETLFKKFNPAYPFDYKFMDVEYEKKFKYIKLTQTLANGYALLAVIITGLGIFGLAAYTAEQRRKEIGIRKVLGASVIQLVSMISKDFTKLILIAFALAAPLSWWFLDNYLDRYPIRVDISWWVFPSAGLIALIFALLIVSNQALKAAISNPVKSLRIE
ncbi:MAG: ABC transporter permease [Bacteroidota bacterium]